MASPAKKPRTDTKAKSFYAKQARKGSKNSIEVGDKGFLVTCNFREKDSTREVYRLLNEYYSKLHKEDEDKAAKEVTAPDDDDIESQLKNEIEKTAKETKEKAQKFQSLDTGVQNLIFIKTTIDDPRSLAESIIRDLAETKVKKTKVTLRMLPVETVCKAKIEDIKNASGKLFDKYFLKEPSTFAINFNKRFNNDLQRDEVIKELAEMVAMKNVGNKVNLKDPQQSIIVEIVKGNCLIAVVPDYLKLKKYNVNELWDKKDKVDKEEAEDDKESLLEVPETLLVEENDEEEDVNGE